MKDDDYFEDFEEDGNCGGYRSSDPDTSVAAAKSIDVSRLEQLCIETWAKHGGLTTYEIADIHGIPVNSISPRPAPLRRKGLIYDSGERRPGTNGRNRIVWKLTSQQPKKAEAA